MIAAFCTLFCFQLILWSIIKDYIAGN